MPLRPAARCAALAAALALLPAHAVELFQPMAQPKSARAAPPGQLVGTAPVGFDAAALAAMEPGEVATFGLPNGRRYAAVLSRLEKHANGDLSWSGHVQGSPDHHVMLTIGASGTYGRLHTEDGTWGVVPGEGQDWLFDVDFSTVYVDRSQATDARVPQALADRPRPKAEPVCAATTSLPTPQTTIDVMFVLTPDFTSAHGGNTETRLNNLVASLNSYYAASRIAVTLRRVATLNVSYPTPDQVDGSTALDEITGGAGVFANVAQLRTLYGADMVVLMRGPSNGGNGISGVGWIGGYQQSPMSFSRDYMYAVAGDATWAGGTLLAHEMGHNMGNNHDPSNAGGPVYGATSYAWGYTRCGTSPSASCPGTGGFNNAGGGGFGTIMSYWRPTAPRFSNPNDTCNFNGSGPVACGGTVSSLNPAFSVVADETRAINCVRQDIAAFSAAHVPDCAAIALDTDRDGAPDCVERALGSNVNLRDNDIFAASRPGSLRFAMQTYRDFLSREGDIGGIDFWTSALLNGSFSRASMVESFFNSPEFQGSIAPVARLYFAYFLRIPDYNGMQYWIGRYRAGVPLAVISSSFAASPEFQSRYGALDNGQFVTLVYNNVLGRAPDAGGFTYWKGQLDSGAQTRGDVMLGFSESPEYRAAIGNEVYVTMAYMGMLRRGPDAGGFSYWVGQMDAGASGLALIGGFLASPEYRGRFLP